MYFFAIFIVVAIASLLFGSRMGKQGSRRVLIGALTLVVASFVIYVAGTNYSRTSDHAWELRRAAQFVAIGGSWAGLYVAAGILGPALVKWGAQAIAISVAATIAALTLGTVLMFGFACALAGECL